MIDKQDRPPGGESGPITSPTRSTSGGHGSESRQGCERSSIHPGDHVGPFLAVRYRKRSGAWGIRRQCDLCGLLLGSDIARSRFTAEQLEAMPVVSDAIEHNPPCDRCGQFGTERHHWAPRSIFGAEASLWPTAWLCVPHHREWHVRTGVAKGWRD